MSWHDKLTDTQKARYIFMQMVFESLEDSFKFPLPRGAYAHKEKPTWYDGKPLHAIAAETTKT